MEEPSDSSRQRAPDLTTFLVTSYEHLRLKTPLISRIHRARFKLHKVHEVEISPVCRETMAKLHQEDHDRIHKIVAEKYAKKGATVPPNLYVVQHDNPEGKIALLHHLSQISLVEGGISVSFDKWSLDKKSASVWVSLSHETVTEEQDPNLQHLPHRHQIIIRMNGDLVIDRTYRCFAPWSFLCGNEIQDTRRELAKSFPKGFILTYDGILVEVRRIGMQEVAWSETGLNKLLKIPNIFLTPDKSDLYWPKSVLQKLIKNLKSKPLGEASALFPQYRRSDAIGVLYEVFHQYRELFNLQNSTVELLHASSRANK